MIRAGLTVPSRPLHHCVFQVMSFIVRDQLLHANRCRSAVAMALTARRLDYTRLGTELVQIRYDHLAWDRMAVVVRVVHACWQHNERMLRFLIGNLCQ